MERVLVAIDDVRKYLVPLIGIPRHHLFHAAHVAELFGTRNIWETQVFKLYALSHLCANNLYGAHCAVVILRTHTRVRLSYILFDSCLNVLKTLKNNIIQSSGTLAGFNLNARRWSHCKFKERRWCTKGHVHARRWSLMFIKQCTVHISQCSKPQSHSSQSLFRVIALFQFLN